MNDFRISELEKADFPEAAKNWALVFGDTEETAGRFLDAFSRDGKFLKAETDGRIAASVGFVNLRYRLKNAVLPAGYIYAALTVPEHRGKSLMGELVRHGLRDCYERGIPICAVYPASDSLYGYYERFGFSDCFFAEEKTFTSQELRAYALEGNDATPAPCESSERVPYALHKAPELFRFAADEWEHAGGLLLTFPGGHAFVSENGGNVQVKELVCNSFGDAAKMLTDRFPDHSEYRITAPCGTLPRSDGNRRMGQARITNVRKALEALAADAPALSVTLKTADGLIPENSGVYRVADGKAVRLPDGAAYETELGGQDLCRFLLTGGKPEIRPYFNMVFD